MARSFAPKYFSTSAARRNTPRIARFTFANYARGEPDYLAISKERKRIRIPDEIRGRAATPVTGATGFGRSRLPGIDPSVIQDSARLKSGPLGSNATRSIFANKINDTFNIGETFQNIFGGTVDSTGATNVDEAARRERSKGIFGRIFGF